MQGLTSEPQFLQTTLRSTSATEGKDSPRAACAATPGPLEGPLLALGAGYLDRPSPRGPGPDAAVDDVQDLLCALVDKQARSHGRCARPSCR